MTRWRFAAGAPSRRRAAPGSPRSQPSLMRSTTAPPPRTRRAQRKLNSRSASPMRVPPDQSATARATRGERLVGIPARELPRDAGQARAEEEGLDAAVEAAREGVEEEEQQARVALHRAADVGEHDERAAACVRARAARPREDLAAVAQACAQRAAQVDRGARRPAGAGAYGRCASSPARGPGSARERASSSSARELGEVLVAQDLLRAVGQRRPGAAAALLGGRVVRSPSARRRPAAGAGRERRPPEPAPLAHAPQVERGRALAGLRQKASKARSKTRRSRRGGAREGARGVVEVGPRCRSATCSSAATRSSIRSGPASSPRPRRTRPKASMLPSELPAHPAARTRSSIARAASPRTFSTSSWYLRRMPSVSATTAGSSAWRSSATRAAAQSSVSATPGSL